MALHIKYIFRENLLLKRARTVTPILQTYIWYLIFLNGFLILILKHVSDGKVLSMGWKMTLTEKNLKVI
jgi:hypothetical protein